MGSAGDMLAYWFCIGLQQPVLSARRCPLSVRSHRRHSLAFVSLVTYWKRRSCLLNSKPTPPPATDVLDDCHAEALLGVTPGSRQGHAFDIHSSAADSASSDAGVGRTAQRLPSRSRGERPNSIFERLSNRECRAAQEGDHRLPFLARDGFDRQRVHRRRIAGSGVGE